MTRSQSSGWAWVLPRWRAFARFWRDKDAALWKKLLLVAVAAYVAVPTDLVPDVVPIWGWLDDAGALTFAWMLLGWLLRPYSSDAAEAGDQAGEDPTLTDGSSSSVPRESR